MKLKIKVKAFIGCLMASLLFSTPLLAGFQLSLVDVPDLTRDRLKIFVDEILDRHVYDSSLFVTLVTYKEIFYGSLVQNCTEGLCSYNKDKVDAVIDENTGRAIKAVYAKKVEKGATKDDFATWQEKNTWSQGSDYATILKDIFQNMVVETEGSIRRLVINAGAGNKITITFDSAGSILGVKHEEVDEHNKYDVEYIITDSDTTIKASESTFYGDLSDSTEDNGGMVTNFEATVTLDPDGNLTNKTGKIYVHNHWLFCCDCGFKLDDDALSSAVNGDYVSIDEFSDDVDYWSIDELSGNGDCVSIDKLSDDADNVSIVSSYIESSYDDLMDNWSIDYNVLETHMYNMYSSICDDVLETDKRHTMYNMHNMYRGICGDVLEMQSKVID